MSRKRLKSMEDLRRYLSGLVNRVEGGQVEASVAGRSGFLINILVRIVETGDLEKRIEALEQRVDQNK